MVDIRNNINHFLFINSIERSDKHYKKSSDKH